MCDQDGMCHRELLGTIHYAPASGVPLRKLEPISLRGSGLPVGREAISFVSSLRGRMPPCLRSHATDPTFPYAASQPNLYIDSAPSEASTKFNRFIMTIVHIQSSIVRHRAGAIITNSLKNTRARNFYLAEIWPLDNNRTGVRQVALVLGSYLRGNFRKWYAISKKSYNNRQVVRQLTRQNANCDATGCRMLCDSFVRQTKNRNSIDII